MRKPFKIILYVLILPIVAFDFISYNINIAQELNAKYILPHILNNAIREHVKESKIHQSRENLCVRVNCTSA